VVPSRPAKPGFKHRIGLLRCPCNLPELDGFFGGRWEGNAVLTGQRLFFWVQERRIVLHGASTTKNTRTWWYACC